jgi:ADP-ribosyl-[dinitrogen reductase] hydrolase
MKNKIIDALLGLAAGDALGVPVEFRSRDYLAQNPVKGMIGFGTHKQPAGTWSDDSSLAFCLAEALCKGYNVEMIAQKFVAWYQQDYWTPHGNVFDIGIATQSALEGIYQGVSPWKSGGTDEKSNGNGSLMRTLPLVFYVKEKPIAQRFQIVKEVSSITHAHIFSVLACFIYIEFAILLLEGKEKFAAYKEMQQTVNQFLNSQAIASQVEIDKFHRILENPIGDYEITPIYKCKESEIYSSGYVLSTLEASLWCLLTHDTYADTVLHAVNLGEDTDTTGAVAGGLAGILYGTEAIPAEWVEALARKADILDLANRLAKGLGVAYEA